MSCICFVWFTFRLLSVAMESSLRYVKFYFSNCVILVSLFLHVCGHSIMFLFSIYFCCCFLN
jgi:hypothetical protein